MSLELWGLGQCCSRSGLEEQLDRPWPQRDPRLSSWEAPPGQRLQLHLLEYSCQHYQGFRDCKACTQRPCLVIALLMVTFPASSPSITAVSQNRCADSVYHIQPLQVLQSGGAGATASACMHAGCRHKSELVMSMICGCPTMVKMSGCRRDSGSELTVQLGTLHRGAHLCQCSCEAQHLHTHAGQCPAGLMEMVTASAVQYGQALVIAAYHARIKLCRQGPGRALSLASGESGL